MIDALLMQASSVLSSAGDTTGLTRALLLLFPYFLLIELPFYTLLLAGAMHWFYRRGTEQPLKAPYQPKVSCIITCYDGGPELRMTLLSLCEQTYGGVIEIIPVIDGAAINQTTLEVTREFHIDKRIYPKRVLRRIAKWQRGGRVSSLNAGLLIATGEIVVQVDADTTLDNDAIGMLARHFIDPAVPAVAGSLRPSNPWDSITTMMQTLEYLMAMQLFKTGLSEMNVINNISGAFGAFRRSFLDQIGGWDTHSGEDLDITLRIKNHFGRRNFRIPFEPLAVAHTEVPATLRQFLKQRLRWDGDLYFLYMRKHWHSFNPRLLGWPNFLMTTAHGLFFEMVLPFVIVGYTLFGLLMLPFPVVLFLGLIMYALYLLLTIIFFAAYLLMIAERPRESLKLAVGLPLFPLFMYMLRCWSVVCICNEMFRRSHEETSMAPWWVIRRGNRF